MLGLSFFWLCYSIAAFFLIRKLKNRTVLKKRLGLVHFVILIFLSLGNQVMLERTLSKRYSSQKLKDQAINLTEEQLILMLYKTNPPELQILFSFLFIWIASKLISNYLTPVLIYFGLQIFHIIFEK